MNWGERLRRRVREPAVAAALLLSLACAPLLALLVFELPESTSAIDPPPAGAVSVVRVPASTTDTQAERARPFALASVPLVAADAPSAPRREEHVSDEPQHPAAPAASVPGPGGTPSPLPGSATPPAQGPAPSETPGDTIKAVKEAGAATIAIAEDQAAEAVEQLPEPGGVPPLP